jgi:phage terminase small subunit
MKKQHVLFGDMYIKNDFNGTQAAIDAGYSKNTAASIASRLLRNINIQRHIAKKIGRKAEKIDVTIESILRHLYEMSFFDITTMIDEDGDILPVRMWPPMAGKLISGMDIIVTTSENGDKSVVTKKIKIPSRERNTENLGRYLSMFTDKIKDISDPKEMVHVYVPGFANDEENIVHGVGDNGNGREGGNGRAKSNKGN